MGFNSAFKALISPRGRYDNVQCMITEPRQTDHLILNPLTWKIWWAPDNASRWMMGFNSGFKALISPRGRYDNVQCMITEPRQTDHLTLNPLMWKIWWAPDNASRWQMGFNSAFKGLRYAWVQVSAAKSIINALLWVITQRVVGISYRRFGTTYRSHLQGSILQKRNPSKMWPVGCPETSVKKIPTTRCVITQSSAVLLS